VITFLDIGNVFIFLSGILLLNTAYRDRRVLRGYSLAGTILILLGLTFFIVFYIQQSFWLSLLLSLPNYFYWMIVATNLNRR
jgi:hypothetical protein